MSWMVTVTWVAVQDGLQFTQVTKDGVTHIATWIYRVEINPFLKGHCVSASEATLPVHHDLLAPASVALPCL